MPVYAILTGTPNAIFPNGTRLVRLIGASEFNTLVAAGATPAPGQFLGSATISDFPFNPAGCETATPSCLTQFRRPAFRYQGDLQWAGGQRLSVGYDWEREKNLSVAGFDHDNNGFFVQQQSTFRDRLFVDCWRARRQQGTLQHVRQPEDLGWWFRHSISIRRRCRR